MHMSLVCAKVSLLYHLPMLPLQGLQPPNQNDQTGHPMNSL
jgi:hypothetical protein